MKISGKYVSGGGGGTEFSQEAWGKGRAKNGKEREEKFGNQTSVRVHLLGTPEEQKEMEGGQ